jgi:hypothetical protein
MDRLNDPRRWRLGVLGVSNMIHFPQQEQLATVGISRPNPVLQVGNDLSTIFPHFEVNGEILKETNNEWIRNLRVCCPAMKLIGSAI